MEEKNEAVAWAGAVLVSKEDGDRGSAGDGFGNRMEGESEVQMECSARELTKCTQKHVRG